MGGKQANNLMNSSPKKNEWVGNERTVSRTPRLSRTSGKSSEHLPTLRICWLFRRYSACPSVRSFVGWFFRRTEGPEVRRGEGRSWERRQDRSRVRARCRGGANGVQGGGRLAVGEWLRPKVFAHYVAFPRCQKTNTGGCVHCTKTIFCMPKSVSSINPLRTNSRFS